MEIIPTYEKLIHIIVCGTYTVRAFEVRVFGEYFFAQGGGYCSKRRPRIPQNA